MDTGKRFCNKSRELDEQTAGCEVSRFLGRVLKPFGSMVVSACAFQLGKHARLDILAVAPMEGAYGNVGNGVLTARHTAF